MTLTCQTCGRQFERPHGKGPKPKYCSESHRQRAYRERRETGAAAEATDLLRSENERLRGLLSDHGVCDYCGFSPS